jgi:hypothetical protein
MISSVTSSDGYGCTVIRRARRPKMRAPRSVGRVSCPTLKAVVVYEAGVATPKIEESDGDSGEDDHIGSETEGAL